jgi:hypothetical protein
MTDEPLIDDNRVHCFVPLPVGTFASLCVDTYSSSSVLQSWNVKRTLPHGRCTRLAGLKRRRSRQPEKWNAGIWIVRTPSGTSTLPMIQVGRPSGA